VPILHADGSRGAYEKSLGWLWDAVAELVTNHGIALAKALSFVTTNPARALRLEPRKGRIQVGSDADLVVLGAGLAVEHVFARGRQLVEDGRPIVMSMYEPSRPLATQRSA
jgi:beta-aspartyl-dipeptidase (metallo-type)